MKHDLLALLLPGVAALVAVLLIQPAAYYTAIGIVILGAAGAWGIYRERRP